ncbi:MAG: hypothetical protein ACRDGT_08520 [Candidatus Limnocylindria bacterium]
MLLANIRCVGLACALVLVAACGGTVEAADPTLPPTLDRVAGVEAPPGPVLFEPEQLILPPEEFPLAEFAVARDEPLTAHAWERQFVSSTSPDFHWFTVRLYVLEPDVPSTTFIEENGCDTVQWPAERPDVREVEAGPSGDGARACRYEFTDGQRVLYHTTGYRNVAVVVGAQPRRPRMTDRLALDWLAAMARHQIAIIGRVLLTYPPPKLP